MHPLMYIDIDEKELQSNTKEKIKERINIKGITCSKCGKSGCLVIHGYLSGYAETGDKMIIRGIRLLCNDRYRRGGCGKTHSIFSFELIKSHMIRTTSLWEFFKGISRGLSKKDSLKRSKLSFSSSLCYNIISRFKTKLLEIRNNLCRIMKAPIVTGIKDPLIETIIHLKYAFHAEVNPVRAYQKFFQVSFL